MAYSTLSPKRSHEVLDYLFDWRKRLDKNDEIIVSHFEVESGDIEIEKESHTTTTSTVWVSGGTPGTTAVINLTIETQAGRTLIYQPMIKII